MPRTRATRPVGRRRRAPRLHNAGTGARTAAAVRATALVGVAGGVQGSTPDSPDVSVDVTPAASVAANKRRCRSRAREPPPHRARRRCPTSCSRRRRPSAAGASSCVLHRESRRTQGGPHGPLSPLAGEDAAPEAAPVVSSSTKYDVSYLSADNSVHHIPPNRIERNPASLEVWGWSWPALRTHTSHGSRNAGGSRHCRGLGRLQARKRRTGARESCLKQALPALSSQRARRAN